MLLNINTIFNNMFYDKFIKHAQMSALLIYINI